jgi:phospholipid/cholesterol/gamma-HCH transport system substrate-binding protein
VPKRNPKMTFSELRVGIFMLAALLITGFFIFNSSGNFNPFEKKMRLKTRFENADGLHSGADVQLAGVSIGKVEEVKFLPPDAPEGERIEATLVVSERFDGKPITDYVRTDSTAQMVATSVLGNDKMINITPGTVKGAAVDNNDTLKSATAVSLNQLTQTGNDLLKQINKMSEPATEIFRKANEGEGTLGRVINDERLYDSVDSALIETRATMTRLQSAIDKINRGQGSAGKLINDPQLYNSLNATAKQLEAISTDIRAGRGSAGKLISNDELYNETRAAVSELRQAGQKLSTIADDVKLITTDIRAGRGSAGKIFTDEKLYENTRVAMEKLSSVSTRLESLIADAQAGKGTLGKILNDETLYNNLSLTAANVATFSGQGTLLLDDFRKNPKKYLTIKLKFF